MLAELSSLQREIGSGLNLSAISRVRRKLLFIDRNYLTLARLTLPYLPYLTVPYRTLPLPYLTSYLTLPDLTLPYPLPYLTFDFI